MSLSWNRPHRWDPFGRCALCAMRSTWEGARYACTGVDLKQPKQVAARKKLSAARHERQRQSDASYARLYRARMNVRRRDDSAARSVLEAWEAR